MEGRANPFVGAAGSDAGVQIQLLAQGHVHGAKPRADGRGNRPFDRHARLTNGLERLLRERRAMLRNGCLPGHAHGPLKCDPGGFQASPRRLGHLRPDPIPWNEHHSMAHGRVHCFKRSSASSMTWSEVAKLNRTWDEEPNPSPGTTARLISSSQREAIVSADCPSRLTLHQA